MPLSSQTARIVVLNQLSKFTSNLLKVGQMDAAKVWNRCRDALQSAIKERTNWPDRDTLQKLTKRKFGLHSQSVPMVCHAFLANVKTTIELRKQGRKEVRYPYKEKRFYPLSWPAQAMALDGDRIILPMGRGRKSIVLPRPEVTQSTIWRNVRRERLFFSRKSKLPYCRKISLVFSPFWLEKRIT